MKTGRDQFQALRHGEFRDFVAASFLFNVAILIQEVVIGYELYTLTHNPLYLGLTGLAEAVPFIGLSLYGGHVADVRNKKHIILWSAATITAGSLVLVVAAAMSEHQSIATSSLLLVVYGMIVLVGICRAFLSPAASSLRAFLVPPAAYENAAAWNSSSFQAASILGPVLGGFLYAGLGFSISLLAASGILALSWLLFSRVSNRMGRPVATSGNVMQSVREGVIFVWRSRPILYAISLDLFSVLFGGVVALLPIYAQDLLHVGAQGLGILRAAPSVGAVLTLLVMSRVSPMRHAWRNLLIAVTGFGVSILVFALSPWFAVSVAALFLSGAFDSVSVIVRQTMLQLRTPDHMRGRVMAVNGIFISSSNELGAFESGLAARLLGTVASAVFGGVMTLLIALWVSIRTRDLLQERFDAAGGGGHAPASP